jgi:hypothetical protein
MLQFLQRAGSDLAINIYPYLTYVDNPDKVPLQYALGNYEPGVQDPETGLVYHSLHGEAGLFRFLGRRLGAHQ